MMRAMVLLFAATVSIAACKSKSDSPSSSAAVAAQTFTLTSTGGDAPVKISVNVPSSWKVEKSGDTIDFKVPGVDSTLPAASIVSISPGGADDKERLATAIKMQFEEGPNVKREELSEGRVWVSEATDRNTHARVFVPWSGGVVMGLAMLSKDNAKALPEIRKVLETIKIEK